MLVEATAEELRRRHEVLVTGWVYEKIKELRQKVSNQDIPIQWVKDEYLQIIDEHMDNTKNLYNDGPVIEKWSKQIEESAKPLPKIKKWTDIHPPMVLKE